ncbi:MAG: 5'/3'-nucleotidase SurE [Gammaproteobacteria bacterium]|nr:5'/3'-nucleotidase SurE [Gammaproteobacteria bacterium]
MKILLSNDDGYKAPGLEIMAQNLADIAEITVVAPELDRSGASNSLTLTNPVRAHTEPNGFIRVDGTPTDCVHLAITGLLEQEPDMVIAGINSGANMGDDVLYSGTVAAATEGRFLGLPAIAISMTSSDPQYYATGARVIREIVQQLQEKPLSADTILNINVPDLPYAEIRGFRSTRLGHRHKAEPVVKAKDPRGNTIYWVGPAGAEQDAGPGTDFHAVREGYVSVTPLQVDLTNHSALDVISDWLPGGGE